MISASAGKAFFCPVCGRPHEKGHLDLSFDAGRFEIFRCPCGLGYSNYALDGNAPEIYDQKYYEHIRYKDPTAQKMYIDHLAPYLEKAVSKAALPEKSKRILDVGCATGDFLEYAVQTGWDAEGIDISEASVAQTVRRGYNAMACSIDDLKAVNGVYDVITLWDVIEHLPDMAGALEILNGKLSRDGIIVLKTVSRISVIDFL
ncbi:MAG: class I SAM-dependent methyltransferase, partial [Nitrospiraceae bacterium]|nr:class I SAM-dependent methyltransferase [Nitrospiraceae bacterium]